MKEIPDNYKLAIQLFKGFKKRFIHFWLIETYSLFQRVSKIEK